MPMPEAVAEPLCTLCQVYLEVCPDCHSCSRCCAIRTFYCDFGTPHHVGETCRCTAVRPPDWSDFDDHCNDRCAGDCPYCAEEQDACPDCGAPPDECAPECRAGLTEEPYER
jgi:hypothetical protein